MATGKWAKIGGVWKPITAEWVKVGGVWKQVASNYLKIGGAWKTIPVGEKYLFACEQFSDGIYGLDDTPTDLAGWPTFSITDPADVACDSAGNSYWACANNVYKVALNGSITWTYTGHTLAVLAIAIDAAGNVYTGDDGGTLKKINSSGSEVFSISVGTNQSIYALAVDYSAGQLYVGCKRLSTYALYRVNTSTFTKSVVPINFSHGSPIYGDVTGIAIDEGLPCLYIGTSNGYLLKSTIAGYIYNDYGWGVTDPVCGTCRHVRIGHDGYGYYAGGSSKTIVKFDPATGIASWTYTASGTAASFGCAVDMFGNVYGTWYVAGTSTYNVVRKLSSSGTVPVVKWTWQPYTGAQFRGIAVTPGIRAAGF